ncbi:MAG: type II toxin-antitoxin system VapC family toxin [Rickettsia sp.]|uniref:type II toxin-antitoxin system VapC family toxin n=1 Tax=Rickettsia sp. TaxID=789 RepID=UPI00397E5C3A
MILVDSNIILDIITFDNNWYEWSSDQIKLLSQFHELIINDIIYTEISIGFKRIEELEATITENFFKLTPMSTEALFLAGKAFQKYKLNGGIKNSILPDFFIGAHASILKIDLLTRDISRYKTYFPKINLITPKYS